MDYQQTLDYLYAQLPMFTRVGTSAFKANLDNTIALCTILDDPQHKFKSIHVGGTNGKGSTSHMLAAILQTAGYKTGLYTSPHLKDFRERIRVNGQMITQQQVVDFVAQHSIHFEKIKPSFFEMTVALAFDTFAKEQVDIAVIEVGLGGRLDSTNVITPLLSVITNIGWDHMNILGDTLQLIAAEKAGIIKQGVPVIIGEKQPDVEHIFIEKAQQQNAPILFASEEWDVDEIGDEAKGEKLKVKGVDSLEITAKSKSQNPQITTHNPQLATRNSQPTTHNSHLATGNSQSTTHNPQPATRHSQPTTYNLQPTTYNLQPTTTHQLNLDLPGTYQLKNIKTVLSAVEQLRFQGFRITDDHVATALSQVKSLTGLHGRWETINQSPLTIVDTGHNPEGIQEVLKNISRVNYNHLHFVIGMVNDKDSTKVLSMLPKNATYYFCKPNIPRGLDAETLKDKAADYGLTGRVYGTVSDALSAARSAASQNDLVFVGGSTFVVAEVV